MLLASARVKWHRPPEYYASSNWRGRPALDGGAALINQGVHTVDLLLWLLGRRRRECKGLTATTLHAIESEDVALALLEFESGAVATLRGHDRRLARLPAPRRDLRARRARWWSRAIA